MNANVTGPPFNGGLPLGLSGNRVSRGTPVRWAETRSWRDRDGLPIPDTMLVIGYTTVLKRWQNKKAFYITEHPLPNPDQLNAAIPVAEWEIGLDGKPSKPWKLTYVIYMVDLKTGAVFTYEHDTYGAMLCFNNLEEQIAVYRMLRGEQVWPIVHLEQRPWKSAKYGMQMRPHLQILDWRTPLGGSQFMPQTPTPQLPGPAATAAPVPGPATSAPAPGPAPTASAPAPGPAAPAAPASPATSPATAAPPTASASTVLDHTKPVKPVTVGELIADELPPWA